MKTPETPELLEGVPREQPFTPPAPWPIYPWVILVLLIMGGVWFGLKSTREAAAPVDIASPTEPSAPAPLSIRPDVDQARTAPLADSRAKVMKRCTLNGQVSYTDGDCQAQAQVSAVDLMPNSGWTGSRSAARTTIQRCKTPDGRFFWSATACRERQAQVDRFATVAAGVPFAQQVREAEQQRQNAEPRNAPNANPAAPATPATPTGHDKTQRCKMLDEVIARLDAWARQALPATEQDRIRERRKAARDEQFALGC
jgi:hypothetical protein